MRVTVNIPDDVGDEAERVAGDEEKSISALFAEAMKTYLERRRRDRAVKRIDAVIGRVESVKEVEKEIDRDRAGSDRSIA